MKTFRMLSIVAALFLVGCASAMSGWSKPGATNEQIRRDYAACKKAAPGMGAGRVARGMRQAPQQGDIDSCMKEKGYTMKK